MSAKSLIISNMDVPVRYFDDFLRGLIDGDGCIRNWKHPTNYCEQWSLSIYSGSEKFLVWLKEIVDSKYNVYGHIYKHTRVYMLKYGKIYAKRILAGCYKEESFALERKKLKAKQCVESELYWIKTKM
ncbi:MAG: LAGLIDADG family homing endonuclease [Patescibacteria group bacterium]|nr:LAGLIDADG family homing endonuclease [Patescibacteria group bacterium]